MGEIAHGLGSFLLGVGIGGLLLQTSWWRRLLRMSPPDVATPRRAPRRDSG